ncbi:MAG: acyltransferase, partial [Acidimicrobiia bacterium]|nr:acyltransferase [Acidimicrobiia bacterium]
MALKQIKTARRMAAATPENRNRYADFLRALAILAVVVGHWLMAAVWIDADGTHTKNVLGLVSEVQWLTWALQVMPIFFFVGGFSNWISYTRTKNAYGVWLRGRLRRLVTPTIPLIAIWGGLGLLGPAMGIPADLARTGSQTALIPLWFLAVYVLQVAATPLSVSVWRRFGLRAVGYLAVGAFVTDAVRAGTTTGVGFANYLFVWGAIYLVGHGWATGVFANARRGTVLAIGAGFVLIGMTIFGPY